jgi:hypothetical protein
VTYKKGFALSESGELKRRREGKETHCDGCMRLRVCIGVGSESGAADADFQEDLRREKYGNLKRKFSLRGRQQLFNILAPVCALVTLAIAGESE